MAPKRWIDKTYKKMETMGYSRATVEPVLGNLLDVYGSSYKLIEGEGYTVLLEALLEPDQEKESKKVELQHDSEEEEEEEIEPLVKRSKRSNKQNRDSIPSRSSEVDGQSYIKLKKAESSYKEYQYNETGVGESESQDVIEGVVPLDVVLPDSYELPSSGKQASSAGKHSLLKGSHLESTNAAKYEVDKKDKFLLQLDYLEALDEDCECEPLLRWKRKYQQNQSINKHDHSLKLGAGKSDSDNTASKKNNPHKEPDSLGDAVEEYPFEAGIEGQPLTCEQDSDETIHDNYSYSEGNRSGSTKAAKSKEEYEKYAQEDFLKLHLASSSNGKVKISLMADSSLGPDFLRFKDVIKKVEETQTGFSVLKLMTGLCEQFLAEHSRHPMSIEKTLVPSSSTKMSYYIIDIAKGQEAHEISLINEVSEDTCPRFTYMLNSMYVKFQLARISEKNCCAHCFGDCLTSDISCPCSFETGDDFAYIQGGLLKENFLESCIQSNPPVKNHKRFYCQDCPLERVSGQSPSGKCKGHREKKFIKECWRKCGCGMTCGNRIIQKGINVKLQVFMTSGGKGWGVRVLEDVPKGSFICDYAGEVVTCTELYKRNMRRNGEKCSYSVVLDAGWKNIMKDEKALCLDTTDYGNVARFINHRCFDANLVEIPVEVETPEHHYYHFAFFTTRDVHAFEELNWDYGIDFSDTTIPMKAFKCLCNSEFCRNKKSAND